MPTFNLFRFIVAILIAALVGLVLVEWLGPLLVDLKGGPITQTTGDFLKSAAGWIIGIIVGALWYIRGQGTTATL